MALKHHHMRHRESLGKGQGDSHVHDENASFMELVDDFAWRHADGRNEEAGLLFDDNINELG
jgi:hypothetical protein